MLKKRIIPCLDIKDGRTVKGVNFIGLRDAGDPVELAKRYIDEGADELVFLDISATVEKRQTLKDLVVRIAKEINIPFTVGGGIQTLEQAVALIRAGADKISVNSTAVKRPELIGELTRTLGKQCVVVAIDSKKVNEEWFVCTHGGRTITAKRAIDWARMVERLGAGEILLTSMEKDGTKNGFDIGLTQMVSTQVNIPVIASGGAGKQADFLELFQQTQATAGLAASIFHFNEVPIPTLKYYLKHNQIPIR